MRTVVLALKLLKGKVNHRELYAALVAALGTSEVSLSVNRGGTEETVIRRKGQAAEERSTTTVSGEIVIQIPDAADVSAVMGVLQAHNPLLDDAEELQAEKDRELEDRVLAALERLNDNPAS